MRKLTDEELSRVLSHHAVGLLNHSKFSDEKTGYACVAGAAMCGGGTCYFPCDTPEEKRARQIEDIVHPGNNMWYADNADELLRFLESRGVA